MKNKFAACRKFKELYDFAFYKQPYLLLKVSADVFCNTLNSFSENAEIVCCVLLFCLLRIHCKIYHPSLHNRRLAWVFRRKSAQGNPLAQRAGFAWLGTKKQALLVPGHARPTDRYGTNTLAKYTQKGLFRRLIPSPLVIFL